MAVDLKFTKWDKETPWGFRLVGGVDYEQPLVVVKVIENSIADQAGLCVGDIIVRVNDTSTTGLTHSEAHDLIHSAGQDFTFGIRRGAFTDILVPCLDEDDNSEVEAILEKNISEQQHIDIQIQKENTVNQTKLIKKEPPPAQPANSPVLENLAGQEKVLTATQQTGGKKWSTFLQKPKTAVPLCKKLEEERKILGEPYRVKIVKQPKKSAEERRRKEVKFQPTVTEREYCQEQSTEKLLKTSELQLQSEAEIEVEVSTTEIEETEVQIEEMDDTEQGIIEYQELEKIQDNEEEEEDLEYQTKTNDVEIEPVMESSLSLEEQLAAVQSQLMALSQLPSSIQITLEAVTQQLNKIVKAKLHGDEEDAENYVEDNGFTEEDINNNEESSSEKAEADITENDNENNISDSEMREEEEDNQNGNINYDEENEATVQEEEETRPETIEEEDTGPYAGMTEDEKEAKIREEEAKIREEELLVKKQKEMEEERRKRDWVTRPILLPGGRKWSDPDDVVPKLRTPKMTDEKICSTIDSFSEVIVGKTKGESNCFLVPSKAIASKRINFLKFEPPAKNLDYLQRSEVYRMIHNMEPPVSGIGTRSEKILSEEDYYSNRGAP